MKLKVWIVLSAAFGGVLSNIIDLATRFQQGTSLPTWTYYVGALIWAGCGAGVALVWDEKNLKKAFYLGIGLPALIQLNIAMPGQSPKLHTFWEGLVPSAIAQPQEVNIPGRVLRVTSAENTSVEKGYTVWFLSQAATREESYLVSVPNVTIPVPAYATDVAVQYRKGRSLSVPLQRRKGALAVMEVSIHEKTWSGFLQAMGKRDSAQYEIVAKIQ